MIPRAAFIANGGGPVSLPAPPFDLDMTRHRACDAPVGETTVVPGNTQSIADRQKFAAAVIEWIRSQDPMPGPTAIMAKWGCAMSTASKYKAAAGEIKT